MRTRTLARSPGPDAVLIAFALAAIGVELVATLITTQGHFTYSLDDPYIHLRLSEQIFHGTYGINTGEPASPSSSVLWPFLLAPFAPTPLHPYMPLLINSLAFTATLLVARRILPVRPGVIIAIALALNWVGLVFTGMEHSLQVLLTLLCAQGILQAWRGEPVSRWFWVAAALGPTIRYENLAVTLVSLVAVGAVGHTKRSASTAVLTLVPLAAFAFFLHAQGLPLLPDSVIAKWPIATAPSMVTTVAHGLAQFASNLLAATSLGILFTATLALTIVNVRRIAMGMTTSLHLMPALCAVVVLLMHAAVGQAGSFGRYEVYALSFAALLLAGSERDMIRQATDWLGVWAAPMSLLTAVMLVTPAQLQGTLTAANAAREIYSEQVQLHRLATEFVRGPVAVNDLGAVSYRNPYRVVDLWGLGSDRALTLRRGGRPGWMSAAAPAGSVKAVMIFPWWFSNQIPTSWSLVGCLRVWSALVASSPVNIYATAPQDVAPLRHAVSEWARTLPPLAQVEYSGCR